MFKASFRQDIDAVKMNTYPNNVVFADGTIINTDPDAEKNNGKWVQQWRRWFSTDALKFTPIIDDKTNIQETSKVSDKNRMPPIAKHT